MAVLVPCTFAEGFPCVAAIDSFATGFHPFPDLQEHLFAFLINRPVRLDRDTEGAVAIPGYRLDDEMDRRRGIIDEARGIEPVADRSFTDPGLGSLDVVREGEFLRCDGPVGRTAELYDAECVDLPAVLQGPVIEVGHDPRHGIALVAGSGAVSAEWSLGDPVGVDEIRVVVVGHVHDPESPLGRVPAGIIPVTGEYPLVGNHMGRADTLIFPKINAVEHPGVVSFPPFAFSVLKGEVAVVWNSGLGSGGVCPECRLPPPPGVFVVEGHAEAQALLAAGFRPFFKKIPPGPYVD